MRLSPKASDGFGILFAADFDDEDAPIVELDGPAAVADEPPPAAASTAEPPEARHSAAELVTAQRQAHAAGYAEGLAAAAESANNHRTALLALLAERVEAARTEFATTAARQLDAVTAATLAMVSACLPVLCEHAGTDDLMAVLADLLPSLVGEPEVAVTVHPSQADAIEREFASVLGKNTPLAVQTCPSMGRSDVAVAWRSGSARRDTRAMRREVTAALRRSLRVSEHTNTNEEPRHGR